VKQECVAAKNKSRRIVQALIDLDLDSGELKAIRPEGETLEENERIFSVIEQKFGREHQA
jgi:hypothetical protein